jgi:hypothetical protein
MRLRGTALEVEAGEAISRAQRMRRDAVPMGLPSK